MPNDEGAALAIASSASELPRPKRKVRRRTFAQIRSEEREAIAGLLVSVAEHVRAGRPVAVVTL